jgi:hypothetical protein
MISRCRGLSSCAALVGRVVALARGSGPARVTAANVAAGAGSGSERQQSWRRHERRPRPGWAPATRPTTASALPVSTTSGASSRPAARWTRLPLDTRVIGSSPPSPQLGSVRGSTGLAGALGRGPRSSNPGPLPHPHSNLEPHSPLAGPRKVGCSAFGTDEGVEPGARRTPRGAVGRAHPPRRPPAERPPGTSMNTRAPPSGTPHRQTEGGVLMEVPDRGEWDPRRRVSTGLRHRSPQSCSAPDRTSERDMANHPHSGGWAAEGGGVPLRKRIDLASRHWVEIASRLDPQGGDEVGNRRDGVIRKDVTVEVRMEAQHRGGVGNAPLSLDIRKV